MLRTRIIPTLLLRGESLIKTVNFGKFSYIGDPSNTMRIFNELEVDEIVILDVCASKNNLEPNYRLLEEVASECFMPLTYGGGITTLAQADRLFKLGIEKISLNSSALDTPELVTEISNKYGSQAIIVSIDVRRNWLGYPQVISHSRRQVVEKTPFEWARKIEQLGAGEILLTSVDREGTWRGMDLPLIESISKNLKIPIIANGGVGHVDDIIEAVTKGGASAVALGSLVVFQKKDMGVLVNFPDQSDLRRKLETIED